LEKALSIHPTKIAFNNLGVAHFHLGQLKDASNYFLLGSEPSDWAMYSHVKCLIELGNINEAKINLDTFSEKDDEFVGEVYVADLFVELKCHEEAVLWFEKSWDVYAKDPNWISRYVYSLVNLNNPTRAQELLNETINEKIEEIKDMYEEECDEDWTEIDKKERIKELLEDKKEYEQIYNRISECYFPKMKFETSIKTACYLFGCKRHNHSEYQKQ
jgi:tetratricopeptide (TPR) repeat protein